MILGLALWIFHFLPEFIYKLTARYSLWKSAIQLHHLPWFAMPVVDLHGAGAVVGSLEILLSMGWPGPGARVVSRQEVVPLVIGAHGET